MLLRLGLIIKAIDALFEVIGGILLFYPRDFAHWVSIVFQHELIRRNADPRTVETIRQHAVHAITGASIVAALYLMAHGIAKIIFISGVLKQKRWGYNGLVTILIVFTLIELFRSVTGGGWALFVFGVFDAFLAWLVWSDFRKGPVKRINEVARQE